MGTNSSQYLAHIPVLGIEVLLYYSRFSHLQVTEIQSEVYYSHSCKVQGWESFVVVDTKHSDGVVRDEKRHP